MIYYRTCPSCGAALDPGELTRTKLVSDRRERTEREASENKGKAAQGAANTRGGKAEQIEQPVSAFIVSENQEDCKR